MSINNPEQEHETSIGHSGNVPQDQGGERPPEGAMPIQGEISAHDIPHTMPYTDDERKLARKVQSRNKKWYEKTSVRVGGAATLLAGIAGGAVLGLGGSSEHTPSQQPSASAPATPGSSPSTEASPSAEASPTITTSPEYKGPSPAELDKLAENPDQFVKLPLSVRLAWANNQNSTSAIDFQNMPNPSNYTLDSAPSVSDNGQTIMNNYLYGVGTLVTGYQTGWVTLPNGSTGKENDYNRGASYFSSLWDFTGPNASDNLQRFNSYLETARSLEGGSQGKYDSAVGDNFTVTSTKTVPNVMIDGKSVPAKEITATTEAGQSVTDIQALYPYMSFDGQQQEAWVTYSVVNSN